MLENYFIDNPSINAKDVEPLIREAYNSAVRKQIRTYRPITVDLNTDIRDSYEQEIHKAKRETRVDESTMGDY